MSHAAPEMSTTNQQPPALALAHCWAFVEVALLYREATIKAKRGSTIEDINAEVMAQIIARHAD